MSGGRSKQSWRSGEENIGQPISPRHLSGLIGDFIVANLNHGRQEAMLARVPADRVVNEICRSIGLVDADGERWVCGKTEPPRRKRFQPAMAAPCRDRTKLGPSYIHAIDGSRPVLNAAPL